MSNNETTEILQVIEFLGEAAVIRNTPAGLQVVSTLAEMVSRAQGQKRAKVSRSSRGLPRNVYTNHCGGYIARVSCKGKPYNIGTYSTAENAAAAVGFFEDAVRSGVHPAAYIAELRTKVAKYMAEDVPPAPLPRPLAVEIEADTLLRTAWGGSSTVLANPDNWDRWEAHLDKRANEVSEDLRALPAHPTNQKDLQKMQELFLKQVRIAEQRDALLTLRENSSTYAA